MLKGEPLKEPYYELCYALLYLLQHVTPLISCRGYMCANKRSETQAICI